MMILHKPLNLRKLHPIVFSSLILLLFAPHVSYAQTKRVVLIKADGLSPDMIERFVHERDPRTGKSPLPWIQHVFYERGTRVANFYVRGMSLSTPSWSLLDTGQHLQIKGNVEYDRYTLHSYDYLNAIPLWVANIAGYRVDMPGVEMMDNLGIPLLFDSYPNDERYLSFQLYQRGIRWTTLQRALQNRFTSRSPYELFNEWVTTGIEGRGMVYEQLERELKERLHNPRILYLDYYVAAADHASHTNRDRETHLYALQSIDEAIGRIWTDIRRTPMAAETALILVSDHGSNTDERVYSQGYNLVRLLNSAQGGGHHVVTKRVLLMDYSIKGIYPLVPLVTTPSSESFYLKGQSDKYPTALLDFDGNERASIHLRDSDLNLLQILLQQLQRKDISHLRRALTDTFFSVIDRRRAGWNTGLAELDQELGAVRRLIEKQRALVAAQPKKWTKEDKEAGRDREVVRNFSLLRSLMGDEQDYTSYVNILKNLLGLRRESFNPSRLKVESIIPSRVMGDRNPIYELQNYVAGIAPGGLALLPDGALDMERSFTRVNYFKVLHGITMRNNVQPRVSNRPVDFTATRIPREEIAPTIAAALKPDDDVVWLYGGPERQALILARHDAAGRLSLRFFPVADLTQDANGAIRYESIPWRDGLPLKMLEDERLNVTASGRAAWLDEWHTDTEWLSALHQTMYSNALIGLNEQLTFHRTEGLDANSPGLSEDERLIRRFRLRQRRLVEPELLVLANNHWNFDVRGFNPGGNHGSFFRVSTHSTLMLAGGEQTGIPNGVVVEEPYDSLSFVPTLLALTGRLCEDGTPAPNLLGRGFRPFPGRVIEKILGKVRVGSAASPCFERPGDGAPTSKRMPIINRHNSIERSNSGGVIDASCSDR